MTAGYCQLTIEQGADWNVVLSSWTDSNGALVNLTGYTAQMEICDSPGGDNAYVQLTTSNGKIAIDTVAKTITLQLTAAQTSALTYWKKAVYDLFMTDGSGVVTRLIYGDVIFIPRNTLV